MAKTIFLTSAWFGLELGRGAQFFLDLGLRGSRKAPGELQESSRRAPGELQESSRRAPGQPPGELQDSLLQESSRRAPGELQESSRRAPGVRGGVTAFWESSRRAPYNSFVIIFIKYCFFLYFIGKRGSVLISCNNQNL